MNEDQFQNEVFNFIPQIIERKIERNYNNLTEIKLKGSSSEKGVIDFSDKLVDTPIISRQYFSDLSDKKIFIIIKGIEYGFLENDYKNFYKFIYKILGFNEYQEKVSADYLKEKILLWIVDVHINGKVLENFMTYLYRNISNDVKNQTYYFPILNMEIEKEFNIGKARITYFSKKYLEEFYQSKLSEELEKSDFEKSFGKFIGKVLVSVDILAENKLANVLAIKKASYIIDVLKLTSPTVEIPFEKCFLELESKIPFDYEYLSFINNDISKFTYHIGINREHELNYTIEMIENWSILFDTFGNLIEKKDEKSNLITNSISFYSKCLSEDDLHLRISKLIMIIESIFLKDEENFKMEIKSKRRFLDFRFGNDNKQKNKFKIVLNNMYEIRHKMTHKSTRLYIDNNELRDFQQEIIQILFMISKISSLDFNKEDFLNSLDKKANV